MAPALPSISKDLNLTNVESVLALSIFVLATAFAPMLVGPLSEVYGRAPLMHTTNVIFLAFNIACGFARNGATLIAARLFAGLAAGSIFPLAAGVMGDLFPPENRAKSYSYYLLIPLLGVAIGPLIGGFVETYSTWRWLFWSTSALQVVLMTVCFLCYKETHLATIIKNKHRRQNTTVTSRIQQFPARFISASTSSTTWHLISQSLLVPLKQYSHTSVQMQSLLGAFDYGILYLVLSTFSSLFTTQYHQSIAISGLHYLAICLGEIAGSQICGYAMGALASRAKRMTKAEGFQPEFHLPIIPLAGLAGFFGFVLYGWGAQRRLHWAIVDVGAFFLTGGMQVSGVALQAYNMDSYPKTRASTTAAVRLFSCIGAFALPLAGPAMYASRLGYGWSNTMLGSLYVVGNCCGTWYLWQNGSRLRLRVDA
jgi:MFS family permease